MGANHQAMPLDSQRDEPFAQRLHRIIVKPSRGFVEKDQPRCFAGKCGEDSCENGDFTCLALRKVSHLIVGAVGQMKGIEERGCTYC